MVFADSLTKAGRLLEIQRMFWRSAGRGIRTARIASELGIAPRTVRKYLTELSGSGRLPLYRDGRRWRLVDNARLEMPPVTFLLEEATAVYLAARLLMQHADQPNPSVRGAVGKLAAVVPRDLSPVFDLLVERAACDASAPFAEIFQALAYGWALSRVVRLEYAPRSSGEPFACAFRPFLLEPSRLGAALYAIGRADPPGQLRVFKAERITSASLTMTTFTPPEDHDLLDRLDRAWGVWLTDEEPVEVRLRFAPDVAARVAETRWHPSQRLERLPNGGLEMSITIASTVELLPWILGWGGHCEVLAPKRLRAEVAAELRCAADRYSRGAGLPRRPAKPESGP